MKPILPPTYFAALLLLCFPLHFLFPVGQPISTPYSYLGIILIVFGAALNLWADGLFKKGGTTVKPNEKPTLLITSGPFSISRHPMYLGMASILLGMAMVLGSVTPFLSPVLFVILMERLFIPLEERSLEQAFGEEYAEYKKRVRRWI